MLAVTVVTPSYRHLEKEAVKRFKKNSGLPVKVIRVKDKDGFMAKLELDRHCGRERIVFFDVDYWLLRPVDFSKWDACSWMAVNDSATLNPWAFPHTDCEAFGMDKLRYFNSGMFMANFNLQDHRKVFQLARRLHSQVGSGKIKTPKDKTDQIYLNLAAQRLNISTSLLPAGFNFYLKSVVWGQLPFIPRNIIGLHAAGEPLKSKLSSLKAQAKVFGFTARNLHSEVVHMEQTRIFDFR